MVRGSEFRKAFRQGIRLDGPLFLMVAAANGRAYSRLGLAASRKVGGAVARNRAKRVLRESFRRLKTLPGFDLVLIPKAEILECTQPEVEREYRDRLRRLAARGPARRGRSSPSPAH
jgi:ribonuclease P protein component